MSKEELEIKVQSNLKFYTGYGKANSEEALETAVWAYNRGVEDCIKILFEKPTEFIENESDLKDYLKRRLEGIKI